MVDKGGFPVFLRRFGEGPEPAVLMHCALAHSKAWGRLAQLLSDRLTMVAPDMPGHGRSAAWDNRCDIHDQVTAIAKDCLGDGAHLIGHSFGATVALRVAMEEPDRVRSVTLIEPVLFAAARNSEPAALKTYIVEEAGFSTALQTEDWDTAAQEFTRVWGDGRAWDSLSEKERAAFANQMHFIRDTEAILLHDSAGLLKPDGLENITCPTCLIRGSETNPIIPAIHAALAARIPKATDAVIQGAGHMVPITHPEAVAARIDALLAGYHLQRSVRCAI
ncbi:alpha/beta fold hydrolase [Marivita hallyeonensis]|uniref:alpha/beta fold hydrolase n=1 Tax=Marivita hallyeonensis TaxID=996342 RepID=UPI0009FE055A|nr:alpha/beta hydrolase [Marivita hallyeonensis]